jgi:carbon starvation protein
LQEVAPGNPDAGFLIKQGPTMNILFLLFGAVALFVLGSRFYAGIISRNYGVDPNRTTPSVTVNDGRDYVPTRLHVIFAHHFSAIAGAGPIIGPTMAMLYGYAPAYFWIVIGCIFIGAVHDFSAVFVSIREGGRSMAEVSRSALGRMSFLMFILFTIIMLVLVTSNFLAATAMSLTSKWPLEKLGLGAGQTLLKVVTDAAGKPMGVIGGIASTSVIIVTLTAPLLGFLLYRRNVKLTVAYPLAAAICIGSVVLGLYIPISLNPQVWMVIISIYVLFAATLPVWFILQPRDFINVQILYAGLGLLALGVLIGGFKGMTMNVPAMNLDEGMLKLGALWPMLFITIACGAVSGFHSLVAGGTTAKQVSSEKDIKRIGYDAMILEGVLALLVLLALGSSLDFRDYRLLVWPTAEQAAVSPSNPILAFSLGVGNLLHNTLAIPQALATIFGILLIEGFVITTLDAAVRLNRYLFEELWSIFFGSAERVPGILKNSLFNSGLSVALMALLAFTNSFNSLWPLFGTSNQLLAALTLVVLAAWLIKKGRQWLFALLPALFLLATTLASLYTLLNNYIATKNYLLIVGDIVLIVLALGMAALMIWKLPRIWNRSRARVADDAEYTLPSEEY